MTKIVRGVRPDSEWLQRVLRDEAAVLANDHDGGDGGFFIRIPIHRRLHFDSREFADSPLAVAATWATSRAARLQGGDDFMLVVRGNAFVVVHHILLPRLVT